jgi:hypothetical protein
MGKWATYRKRGSHNGASALPPPPQPTLLEDIPDLVSSPETAANVGGQLVLEFEDGPGNWTFEDNRAFAFPLVNWGATASFPSGNYRAYQIGNGVDFAGNSTPSDAFLL